MSLAAAVMFAGCSEKKDIVPLSDKWMLVETNWSIGEEDEIVITPTFSSEEVRQLDYVWTSSDPDIVEIIEDNNSSITILGVSAGNTQITVECPGETKRLSATLNVSVSAAPLRILAIGNSFSQDAIEQYLWNMFNAVGVEAVIGNMYIGGCSLERHWSNAESGDAAYEYRKVVKGEKTNSKNVALETALADENWDYISLQQASDYSGMYDKYEPYLEDLIVYVREHATNPHMKLMFHQTWAYAQNSTHQAFTNYGKDQMVMYEGIVDASRRSMETHPELEILIPCGTTIQNGRTTSVGDNWNRDGYHLNVDYGRFAAACTWYESVSGNSVLETSWKPSSVTDDQAVIARTAAHNAVLKPYEVTDMSEY